MDHVLNSFLVILAQINDACFGFSELIAAGTVEETRSGAKNSPVDVPFPCLADDGQIGVSATKVQPVICVNGRH